MCSNVILILMLMMPLELPAHTQPMQISDFSLSFVCWHVVNQSYFIGRNSYFRCGPPSCMLIKTAFLQLVSETLHACMHAFLSVFGIKNSLGSGRIRLPSPYFLHMNVDHLTSIIVLWFNQVKTKLTEQPKCKFISRLG